MQPRNTRTRRILTAALLACVGPTMAQAEGLRIPEYPQENESQWSLGAGIGFERSPYRDVGNETSAIPLLGFQNRYVRFFGTTFDAKLPSAGPVDFSIRARYALGDGYKSSDSSYLSGMDKREGGLWLGLASTWHSRVADVSLEWMRAVGKSKGNRIKLAVERSFAATNRIHITPYAGIQWSDSKDVDYYFGVKDSEVTAERARYEGKSSTNINAGIRIDYTLTRHQNLFLDVGVQRWGSGVTDSPLVRRSTSPSLRMGYLYRF